jgi:hypothetical protein
MTLQPNNALDIRFTSIESRGPCKMATAQGAELPCAGVPKMQKGRNSEELRPLRGMNRLADQALAASAFTRDDRRDILRATVFLCSTPLVTPRASSGWAAFSAAAALPVARSDGFFDLAQEGADARAAGLVDGIATLGLAGALLGLGGIAMG